MPSEDTKRIEFNQYPKLPFIIYAGLECLIEKIDGVTLILRNYLWQKWVSIFHQVFQYLQYHLKTSFKHDLWRDKDYMKTICESLREHAMKVINCKKKKMKLLTENQQELY